MILVILQEKIKPAQTQSLFNEEEKEEKNDRPHIAKSNQAQDTLWSSEEPEAVPVPRGTDVGRQVTKEKVRDFLILTWSMAKIQYKNVMGTELVFWLPLLLLGRE